MRIAVATERGGLDDRVSDVFGRAQTFTIVETEGEEIRDVRILKNTSANFPSGAGIQAAQMLVNEGVEAVIAGRFGPNASSIFSQSGVRMVTMSGVSVEEAVKRVIREGVPSESSPSPSSPFIPGMGMGMRGGRGGWSRGGMGMRRGFGWTPEEIGGLDDLKMRIERMEKEIEEIKRMLKK
ncbi:MAG: hypothetical protein PWR13_1220 [Archaeoglobi archaeon]|nr:hypothetical protein [Archaeoglobi archaeon]MDK2782192.1 hypothetical protein [Archaeoglobi archaeon]